MKDIYDITIIGGGPAGLYSAFYGGLRELKTKIIEFRDELGGKLHIYPEKIVWDIGGLPATPAAQVIENIVKQGLTFEPTVCLNTKVHHIRKEDDIFVIETDTDECHYSKKVILASGGGIFCPTKLMLHGAEKYEVSNLHYTIKGIQNFKDKSVIISGGGNSAIDWARDLVGVAKDIQVVYRGDKLSAHEAPVRFLKENNVPIIMKTQIQSLIANDEKTKISDVVLENVETGELSTICVDDVLVNHGYDRVTSFTFDEDIQPTQDEQYNYYYMTNDKCLTSVDGIYAVGDICKHSSKVYLITGTFPDAVNAVNDIKQKLDETALEYATVSSHNEAFNERNRKFIQQQLNTK